MCVSVFVCGVCLRVRVKLFMMILVVVKNGMLLKCINMQVIEYISKIVSVIKLLLHCIYEETL